jgi:GWxTD domain-containing protein
MFVEPEAAEGRTLLRPYVFSGNISFGSRDALAIVLLNDAEDTDYTYVVKQLPYQSRDIRWWDVSEIQGRTRSSTTTRLTLSPLATTSKPYLESIDDPERPRTIALAQVPVPVTTLVPGNYQIQLVRDGAKDTLKVDFRIQWEKMPLSLRSLDYAIEALKYIVKEDELDAINSGSDAVRRLGLMNWWRRQDPTGTTTYNERMAEYYHRLDQAFFAFSTIMEPDGADTERGKVYVLFGPPSTIEKNLAPNNQPQEIWTYTNSVKKTFTFSIDERGIYKLTAMGKIV